MRLKSSLAIAGYYYYYLPSLLDAESCVLKVNSRGLLPDVEDLPGSPRHPRQTMDRCTDLRENRNAAPDEPTIL